MIIGVGVDIIEIERIKKACSKESFVNKVYTQNEIKCLGKLKFNSLAGNFAIKEAVSKVFGTGISGFQMTDIEVLRNENGMPFVVLHNQAKNIANKLGISKICVSISHDKNTAIGYAIGSND